MAGMTTRHAPDDCSTSLTLLQRARDGDADGWQQLVQVYGPTVYSWARQCGCQEADAADVVQDTFASVANALEDFDAQPTGATFRGWLWTIARNKVRDQARNASRQPPVVGGTDANLALQRVAQGQPPSSLEVDLSGARRRLVKLMEQDFDPRSWRMFWESTVIGRSPEDVAAEMEVSKWAVYKARARVLQRLKQRLEGLE